MQAVSSADNVLGHLQLVQEGLGFALLPDSVGALLPPGVVLKPLAYDPVPTVSIVLGWKAGNTSPLIRAFVDLVRQPVRDEVGVGRDVDAVDLDVVAGVGDDRQLARHLQQAAGELGAARAAREEGYARAGSGHPSTKMSSARSACFAE